MNIDFVTKQSGHIRTWANWKGAIPNIGDTVQLCWNYGGEAHEDNYRVIKRIISERTDMWVTLIVTKI